MEGDKKGWETRRRRIYIILYEQSVVYNLKICIVLITDVYIDAINRKEGVESILSYFVLSLCVLREEQQLFVFLIVEYGQNTLNHLYSVQYILYI